MNIGHTTHLVDAYEQLRRYFTIPAKESPSLNGLALFIHKGMGAWMRASTYPMSSGSSSKSHAPQTASAPPEIIELLATMTLASGALA